MEITAEYGDISLIIVFFHCFTRKFNSSARIGTLFGNQFGGLLEEYRSAGHAIFFAAKYKPSVSNGKEYRRSMHVLEHPYWGARDLQVAVPLQRFAIGSIEFQIRFKLTQGRNEVGVKTRLHELFILLLYNI